MNTAAFLGNFCTPKNFLRKLLNLTLLGFLTLSVPGVMSAQDVDMIPVTVKIENIAPEDGVAITPVWVGFHSGSFDSYNGGLTSLPGLERLAEDGDNSLISMQFNDFDPANGGYTYVDNSGVTPASRLVRTGDLSDMYRQDANVGTAPLLPGQAAEQSFMLRNDGSNRFFSYGSMVLPTNDFFIANGNPMARDLADLLQTGGQVTFFIGSPNGGVNDAGTERENLRFSAGNGLFPGRNLPAGQSGPNTGQRTRRPIANVLGNGFASLLDFRSRVFQRRVDILEFQIDFFEALIDRFPRLEASFSRIIDRLERRINRLEAFIVDLNGFDFNQYPNGIARVTITAGE